MPIMFNKITVTVLEGSKGNLDIGFKTKPGKKTLKRLNKAIDKTLVFKNSSKGWGPINEYWLKLEEELKERVQYDDNDTSQDEADWFSIGEISGRVSKRTTQYSKRNSRYSKDDPEFAEWLTHLDSEDVFHNIATFDSMEGKSLVFEFGYDPDVEHGLDFELGTSRSPSYPLIRRTWKANKEDFPKALFEGVAINFKENFEK